MLSKVVDDDQDEVASPSDGAAAAATRSYKAEYLELDDLSGGIYRPHYKAFKKLCKPCHAWALTIHKFQGSETDNVVYGVSSSKFETWQHVYTAVTRGKKMVTIVGKYADLMGEQLSIRR